jgi:hypothetical protein
VHVEAISIGPTHAIAPVDSVSARAGMGLEGDRHFSGQGAKPGRALTLIEAEALADVCLTGAGSRRRRMTTHLSCRKCGSAVTACVEPGQSLTPFGRAPVARINDGHK